MLWRWSGSAPQRALRPHGNAKPQEPPEKPGGTRRGFGCRHTEFAEKGYDNASTNSIVDAVGTSKGLLFHYFGSKDAYTWQHSITASSFR